MIVRYCELHERRAKLAGCPERVPVLAMVGKIIDVSDETQAVVRLVGWHGSAEHATDIGQFAAEFYAAAAEAGADTEPAPLDADLEPFGAAGQRALAAEAPAKSVTVQTVAMVICLFVGTEVASWAVAQTSNVVWRKLSPSISRLLGKLRRRKPLEVAAAERVVLRTVYAKDQVVVELELNGAAVTPEDLQGLLAKANELAVAAPRADDAPKVLRYVQAANNVDVRERDSGD